MRFSHDRRGQSVVVGTVILFGFLIVALALYQAQIVPMENADVEFEHSQSVENDVTDLRNAILRASTAGSAQPARVQLGTRYPQRTFFVNPAPATGSLETSEPGSIRIENAAIGAGAHENTELFWTEGLGGEPAYETTSLQYRPTYNEYREAPTLTYEHSVVAAEFPNGNLLLRSNQTVLRDGRVSLTALTGEISENGVESRSVDPEAVSAGSRTVPVTSDGDEIEIVLPTTVGNEADLEAEWDERVPNAESVSVTDGAVRITLSDRSDPYRLRLSAVSVDGEDTTGAAYIVPVGPEAVTAGQSVGVEVRDEYHNPVADADVSISDGADRTTDDGRVFFTPGSNDSTASISDDPGDPDNPEYESVTFSVTASEEAGELSRVFDVDWRSPDPREVIGEGDETITVQVTDRDSDEPIEDAGVDVSFAVKDGSGPADITLSDPETDEDGQVEATLDVSENERGDEFSLYASAGDDVDRIEIEISDADGFDGPTFATLTANEERASPSNRRVTFDWSIDGEFDTITFETEIDSQTTSDSSGPIELDKGPGAKDISATVDGPGGSETCTATIVNDENFDKDDFNCAIDSGA